jgi:hypothetical protein
MRRRLLLRNINFYFQKESCTERAKELNKKRLNLLGLTGSLLECKIKKHHK